MTTARMYLFTGAAAVAVTALIIAAVVLALALESGSRQAAAAEPRVVFYREGSLFVADLNGAATEQIAPASVSPLYAGGATTGGETVLYYSARDGSDLVVHRRFLSTNKDEILTTVTGVPAAVTLRLSRDGHKLLLADDVSAQIIETASAQSSRLQLPPEYGYFRASDWSPDNEHVLIWAATRSSDVGSSLIVEAASGKVLGTVPGDRASWSASGSRVCGSTSGPPGDAIATVWIATAPDWTSKPGVAKSVLPVTSCDWISDQELVFVTRPWPLDPEDVSPVPTVTAEIWGATDKSRPEETKVFIGTTRYAIPVLGILNIATSDVRILTTLRQDIAPGSTISEAVLIEPYSPVLEGAPGAPRAIVSAEGQAPTIVDLSSGIAVTSLESADKILDVLGP